MIKAAMEYVDKNGLEMIEGSIFKHEEGDNLGYGRSINVVIMYQGALHSQMRVGYPEWTVLEGIEPIELRFHTLLGFMESRRLTEMNCTDDTIIGNIKDNPEMLTAEYAHELWPC